MRFYTPSHIQDFADYKRTLIPLAKRAGGILLKYFGKIRSVRQKEHASSVVCDADLASEEYLIRELRKRFPQDGIVAEESGYRRGDSSDIWVIDPLDGTSNFVSGIPWFGVQFGLLRNGVPIATVIFLPVEGVLYFAEAGKGVSRNGKKLWLKTATDLKSVLCAFGFDPSASHARANANLRLLRRISQGVRNIRATNSLVDFCFTLEGRFGACVNLNTKIWDIVPVSLMLPEAGGFLTDLNGKRILFDLDSSTFNRSYMVLGASRALHPKLVALANGPVGTRRPHRWPNVRPMRVGVGTSRPRKGPNPRAIGRIQ